MNNIENAIETLQNYSPCSQENLYQAHQVAISALEKQIAREPVNRCATFTIAQCPHCNGTISFHHKYCHWCGQKLDWSEVGNE